MRTNLLLMAALCISYISAQTTATFEDITVGVDTFLNGSDLQGGFSNGNVFLSNTYDTGFNSWFGFGISTKTDITTAGYTNEFSSISGAGYDNSSTYAVAYNSYLTSNAVMTLENNAAGKALEGMYVNNTTYAYLSMRDGDAIAKKFGGITGNDPDFFLLTISAYLNGTLSANSIDFYLADFRFADNTQDFILDEWTYIDLTSLGNADSVSFEWSSSDVGQFGVNTPVYFCLDNITTKDELATGIRSDLASVQLSFAPNPVNDFLRLANPEMKSAEVIIRNVLGQQIYSSSLQESSLIIDLSALNSGLYALELLFENGSSASDMFIKK
jgi:hypothetical protein